MNLLENADHSPAMNSFYLNKYRRTISDNPTAPVKLKRFGSDILGTISFMPIDDVSENTESSSTNHSSSDEVLGSKHGEVKITLEDQSMMLSTMKMCPAEAWCHRTTPNYITCHQVWLVIHVVVTITLCVLYFTHTMKVSAGTIAICELLFGVLVRNEIFVALLHRLFALIPYFKYEFNRMLHCIGGLHVSSAIAAFFWLLISLSSEPHGLGVRITGGIILFLVILLSLTAIPIIRRRFHDIFEHIHRFVGLTCLIILIIYVIFLQLETLDSFNIEAIFNTAVLVLMAIVVIIFLPWICVRKVFVQFKQPSKDLTIITFPRALYPYGSTTRISLDGHEWHAFAIALTDPCTDQHSILVAAAGDWTKNLAESYRTNTLPQNLWIRRIKGLGFMYSIHVYRRVLIVCTGSGIAPALPYIKDPLPTTHTHLLWIAKQHEHNYGEYIWKLVQRIHPHFTLHDTGISGRPGAQLVEDNFWTTNSEAVFVVSNEKFTLEVTNALWRKGIPCFGALFDS
jgi:NAD(P)H-flavin reductase